MNRQLKFRIWNERYKQMRYWGFFEEAFTGPPTGAGLSLDECATKSQQFTGFKDKNGNDVYEGDIFRIEEDDEENTVIYVVVVWVQEWAMFTTLRVEDEYTAYLDEGVDAIDETMFWTYTLEDIDSPKHYPCGNIHETPQLLHAD